MEKEQFDNIEIYCKRLGHYVPFKYCRTAVNGVPCRGIFDCTYEKIPVKEYISEHFSDDEISAFMAPQTSKIASIIDLIEQAKNIKK